MALRGVDLLMQALCAKLVADPPLRRRRLCGSLDFAGDVERMPDGLTVPQDKAHGKPSLSAPKPAPEHRCQVRGDDAHRAGLLRPSDRR